jgi:hypothetical protein
MELVSHGPFAGFQLSSCNCTFMVRGRYGSLQLYSTRGSKMRRRTIATGRYQPPQLVLHLFLQPQVTSMLKAPETELVPDPTGNKSSQNKDAAEQPARSIWDSDRRPETLGPGEHWWRDHYQWLKEAGYLLRPRYDPAWIPSWRGTKKDWIDCEDARVAWVGGRIFYVPCDCLNSCSFLMF